MDKKNLKSLDINKLQSKKSIIVSSQQSLKDITPINWSEDVLLGKKKITISCNK